MIKLVALNVHDILADVDTSGTRAGTCTPNIVRYDKDSATLFTVTRCATSRNAWEQIIQFIDFNFLVPEDERLLVETFDDLKSNHSEVVDSGNILTFCNCPAFQFFYSYISDQLDISLQPENRFPSIRNPNLQGTVCKHLISVFRRFLI
jgi:hypothetical protein